MLNGKRYSPDEIFGGHPGTSDYAEHLPEKKRVKSFANQNLTDGEQLNGDKFSTFAQEIDEVIDEAVKPKIENVDLTIEDIAEGGQNILVKATTNKADTTEGIKLSAGFRSYKTGYSYEKDGGFFDQNLQTPGNLIYMMLKGKSFYINEPTTVTDFKNKNRVSTVERYDNTESRIFEYPGDLSLSNKCVLTQRVGGGLRFFDIKSDKKSIRLNGDNIEPSSGRLQKLMDNYAIATDSFNSNLLYKVEGQPLGEDGAGDHSTLTHRVVVADKANSRNFSVIEAFVSYSVTKYTTDNTGVDDRLLKDTTNDLTSFGYIELKNAVVIEHKSDGTTNTLQLY